jgi:hypothetical protein
MHPVISPIACEVLRQYASGFKDAAVEASGKPSLGKGFESTTPLDSAVYFKSVEAR